MRLEERVGEGTSPVLLEPFGHQVAGQSSMLTVNSTTVCKPLIPREHFVYRTMPPQLLPFTPRYKGVLYVRLHEEEDGRIRLLGYHPPSGANEEAEGEEVMEGTEVRERAEGAEEDRLLALPWEMSSGASTPMSSGSELDVPTAVDAETSHKPTPGCVVRVLQSGSYEVSASTMMDGRFLISEPHSHSQLYTDIYTQPLREESSSSQLSTSPPTLTHHPLNPWGLSCHTRLLDKMRKSRPSPHGCPFIQLENVVARFSRPCILDLKVGSRLHGDNASQQKIASQSDKCNATTSRSLGLRLCGMQVYQVHTGTYRSLDKYHGRKLTDATFRLALRDFLHDGQSVRRELLAPILSRLHDLVNRLKELTSFRFYASSLLIMYDGVSQMDTCSQQHVTHSDKHLQKVCMSQDACSQRCMTHSDPQVRVNQDQLEGQVSTSAAGHDRMGTDRSSEEHSGLSCMTLVGGSVGSDNGNMQDQRALVDVRMIDFAHTTHHGFPQDVIVHEGPDTDYMAGLHSLITLFSQLLAQDDP